MMASRGKKVAFLLRVEEDVLDTLRDLAKVREVSLSQLLRDILGGYVDKSTAPPSNQPVPMIRREKKWWN